MDFEIRKRGRVQCVSCRRLVFESAARVIAVRRMGTARADVWQCGDCGLQTARREGDFLSRLGERWAR